MTQLIYSKEAYEIIGAAMEVHKHLGPGFLEAIYQEALEIELNQRNIPNKREAHINVFYKSVKLNKTYAADFLCFDKIVVETKALSSLTSDHEAQLINYLKATRSKLGILINFGASSLEYKRLVY
ncbi:GxxExxY protein [Parabacteroides sp. FAFU027]|uniref:GxxExxY protein n=1 Tax=Parabacteroides sp. FAFU027 TaxID=2922715 RepID=UPI001FAF92CC|nr:GxxExxY protein [Parabacteroides sp. FAFU027]